MNLLAPGAAFTVEGSETVEQKAHGAGEDAFDLYHLIACINEVFQSGDDGQASSDGGFVVDEPPIRVLGRVSGGEYVAPQTKRVAEGFLVRSHDADAFSQEQWIRLCNVLATGVIHEHTFPRRIGKVSKDILRAEDRLAGGSEIRRPRVERETVGEIFGEEAFAGTGDDREGEVGVSFGDMNKLGEKMLAYATGS